MTSDESTSPASRFPSWPPRCAPDTPPLRISANVLGRMKEYYLLAAGRSGRDPSSGPRRLVRTPVAVHLLPPGEGKQSFWGTPWRAPTTGPIRPNRLGAHEGCPSVPHRIFLPRGNSNVKSTSTPPGPGKLSPFIRLSYISNHLVDADVSGFELQRGGLTKPRPKAWDSKTRSDKAVKGHATLDATNCSSPLQGSTFRVKAHL